MKFELNDLKSLITEALKELPLEDDWLNARYAEQVAIVNHTQPYYKLFYYIARLLKPNFVVELGGWQGTASAHFAAGHPPAKVITIDHHSDPGQEFDRMKMLDVVNHYGVHYFQGWTTPGYEEEYHKGARSVLEDVKKELGSQKIDILFIDSWHEGRYFQRDWDYYSPLLADPALVIVDDVFNDGFFVDMVETFEKLPGEKFTDARLHPGIPMGFVKYGTKSKTVTPARKPRQKRATSRKAA